MAGSSRQGAHRLSAGVHGLGLDLSGHPDRRGPPAAVPVRRGALPRRPGCCWPPSSLALGDPAPAVARATGARSPSPACSSSAAANAIVVWAEQYRRVRRRQRARWPSMPLWAAFFDAIVPGGKTPLTWRIGVGLGARLPRQRAARGHHAEGARDRRSRGPVALTLGERVLGARHRVLEAATRPRSPYAAAAVQMAIAGGLVISLVGLVLGEAAGLAARPRRAAAPWSIWCCSARSSGYTAYGYALEHASATVVGTYAYVNPVVAVLLGWLDPARGDHGRTIGAMVLILGAVLMDSARRPRAPRRRRRRPRALRAGVRGRHDERRRASTARADTPQRSRAWSRSSRMHAAQGGVDPSART